MAMYRMILSVAMFLCFASLSAAPVAAQNQVLIENQNQQGAVEGVVRSVIPMPDETKAPLIALDVLPVGFLLPEGIQIRGMDVTPGSVDLLRSSLMGKRVRLTYKRSAKGTLNIQSIVLLPKPVSLQPVQARQRLLLELQNKDLGGSGAWKREEPSTNR